MKKPRVWIVFVLLLALVVSMGWRHGDHGSHRYFADQTYHHLTMRTLGQIPYGGADTGEVIETIPHIRSGDAESWYAAWWATAERVATRGHDTRDAVSRGRALLRAHNYYRTAEFLLAPDDVRRPAAWQKQTTVFYAGLDALQVRYERISVSYGEHKLRALYFPGSGDATKPLIVACGGFDSTLEELYFSVVAGALERGYSVLLYEGPGQGAALREEGLHFIPNWEKPTGAVLDRFLEKHAQPSHIVLLGMSMGGYLAPRAAAFDPRINGVVAFDVLFDVADAARSQSHGSGLIEWLHRHQFDDVANNLLQWRMYVDPGMRWGLQNAEWVMGVSTPSEVLPAFAPYTLQDVAGRILGDVLILAGAEDHLVPLSQVGQFQATLTHAKSVTTFVYGTESGGKEHCQDGAITLWQRDFFDWLLTKYASPAPVQSKLTIAPFATAPAAPAPRGTTPSQSRSW